MMKSIQSNDLSVREKNLLRTRLLSEIAYCREDERNHQNMLIQAVSATGVVLGAILAASFLSHEAEKYSWLLSFLSDQIFLAALAYIVHIGTENVLRYHYMLALEKKLNELDDDLYINCEYVGWMQAISPVTTHNLRHLKNRYAKRNYAIYLSSVVFILIICLSVTLSLYWQYAHSDKFESLYSVIANIGLIMLAVGGAVSLLMLIVGSAHSKEMYRLSYKKALKHMRNLQSKTKEQRDE